MSHTFPSFSSIASTLRRHTAHAPSTANPHVFRKKSVSRRRVSANRSLGSSLRYSGFRTFIKLHRFFKGDKVSKTVVVRAAPPSRTPSITAPWIFVTPADEDCPTFRSIRRQTHIRSRAGIFSVREAARQRRQATQSTSSSLSLIPQSYVPLESEPDLISFAEFERQILSPEHAQACREIDVRFYQEVRARAFELAPDSAMFASMTPELCQDSGSDSGSATDSKTPAILEELQALSERVTLQLRDLACEVGAISGDGDAEAEFEKWLFEASETHRQNADEFWQ